MLRLQIVSLCKDLVGTQEELLERCSICKAREGVTCRLVYQPLLDEDMVVLTSESKEFHQSMIWGLSSHQDSIKVLDWESPHYNSIVEMTSSGVTVRY